MANELQLPPWLQGRAATASRLQQQLASIPQGSVPHVSTRGGHFRLVDAAGNEQMPTMFVDAVVFDGNPHVSKLYYDKPFDPSATDYAPPTCFSDNGVGASSQAAQPQSVDCRTCQFNVWGSETSRVSGKPTKACNDILKLAIYVPQHPGIAFLLRIPPASIKGWRAYMQSVKGQGVEVSQIVTRIAFDPKQTFVLSFTPVGWIDQATAEAIDQIVLSKKTDALVGADDVVYSGQPASGTAVLPARQESMQVAPPPKPLDTSPEPTRQFLAASGQFDLGRQQVQQPPAGNYGQQSENPAPQQDKPPPKPRGRPRKEEPPQPAPTQAPFMGGGGGAAPFTDKAVALGSAYGNQPSVQDAEVDIPAFLRRGQPAPVPQQTHGMVDAPAPDQALQDMLAQAMSLDTSVR